MGTALSGSRSNVGGGHVVMHAGATLRAVDSSFAEGSIHPQVPPPPPFGVLYFTAAVFGAKQSLLAPAARVEGEDRW